jgi:hypothetical protein
LKRPAQFPPLAGLDNVRNPGGMGLGWYIVREIMAAHHGSLRYRYAAPKVIFDVELPANPHPTAAPHAGTLFKRPGQVQAGYFRINASLHSVEALPAET